MHACWVGVLCDEHISSGIASRALYLPVRKGLEATNVHMLSNRTSAIMILSGHIFHKSYNICLLCFKTLMYFCILAFNTNGFLMYSDQRFTGWHCLVWTGEVIWSHKISQMLCSCGSEETDVPRGSKYLEWTNARDCCCYCCILYSFFYSSEITKHSIVSY